MEQLTPTQLKAWLEDASRTPPLLLDVREPWELDICRIAGSTPIPMRTVPLRVDELNRDHHTVVICHHGARSFQVAMFLEQQGFAHVFNLSGGVAEWARQADPAMPQY